jgi:hypothetical protein
MRETMAIKQQPKIIKGCFSAIPPAAALLVAALPCAAGCYMKSLGGGDAGGDAACDLESVTLEITANPLPYIEEQTGCPNPVYMVFEYKVTNNTGRTIFIDRLKIEGFTKETNEKFFDWTYIDGNHHTLDPGRWYMVRLDGILVGAEIEHTPHLELAGDRNFIRATLLYNAGEDTSCGSFDASDETDVNAGVRNDVCPSDF